MAACGSINETGNLGKTHETRQCIPISADLARFASNATLSRFQPNNTTNSVGKNFEFWKRGFVLSPTHS